MKRNGLNRRDFLKVSAMAGAVAVIYSAPDLAQA
jgi:hypothetical protein